jgi:hypothetical protein
VLQGVKLKKIVLLSEMIIRAYKEKKLKYSFTALSQEKGLYHLAK